MKHRQINHRFNYENLSAHFTSEQRPRRRPDQNLGDFGKSLILLLLLLGYSVAESPAARASIEIEVIIPDRTALYFADDLTSAGANNGSTNGPEANAEAAVTTVFDLSCATRGALPLHCRNRVLDTQGRAYPPLERDADGKVVGGGTFPQYFESPTKTLRLFTPLPTWKLQVDMLEEPGALSANNFSVFSSTNGWHCLGFHPDWQISPALETCPTSTDAARSSVTVVDTRGFFGGWYNITLGLKLRLDGSEPAGNYNGVLRYTLVNF